MGQERYPILTGEEALQVILNWKASRRLRSEFGGDLSRYIGYVEGVVAGHRSQRTGMPTISGSLPFELKGVFDGVPVEGAPPSGNS